MSRLPGGFIASFVLGLGSDNQPLMLARNKEEDIDRLMALLPDVATLSPADLKTSRDALRALIEAPIEIEEKPLPPGIWLPGFVWPGQPPTTGA